MNTNQRKPAAKEHKSFLSTDSHGFVVSRGTLNRTGRASVQNLRTAGWGPGIFNGEKPKEITGIPLNGWPPSTYFPARADSKASSFGPAR